MVHRACKEKEQDMFENIKVVALRNVTCVFAIQHNIDQNDLR